MAKSTILAPAAAISAVSALLADREKLAEAQAKYKALEKAVKATEANLLATVEAHGPFVANGQYVGFRMETKIKEARLGYQELIAAVASYDADMGEEVTLLAQAALDDKAKKNASEPEVSTELVVRAVSFADNVIPFTSVNGRATVSA
jgi:hypothetical protein